MKAEKEHHNKKQQFSPQLLAFMKNIEEAAQLFEKEIKESRKKDV